MTDRQAYYAAAATWADDTRAASSRSRRIAWIVAGVAVAAAAFEAVALAMLVPLKTVAPITLLVDRQTGFVQALDPLTPRRVSADAALTDAFLAQYVAAREGFDRATVQLDYRKVGLWSAERARSSYLSAMAATNPASPLQAYPAGSIVAVRVKSVSRLSQGVSLVRFDTAVQTRDGRAAVAQPWISVVRFRYSDAPMAFADRLVNPLGFQVTSYRRDAEAPPQPPAASGMVLTAPPIADGATRLRPMASTAAVVDVARPRRTIASIPQGSPSISRSTPSDTSRKVREVPTNQIPMGSPLGPVTAAITGRGGS